MTLYDTLNALNTILLHLLPGVAMVWAALIAGITLHRMYVPVACPASSVYMIGLRIGKLIDTTFSINREVYNDSSIRTGSQWYQNESPAWQGLCGSCGACQDCP